MSVEVVYKEDYGHEITVKIQEFNEFTGVTSVVPLAGFTTKIIIVERPNGTIKELDADLVTDGTDGLIYSVATEASNVFTVNGYYIFQARVQNASQRFTSTTFGHDVKVPLS